MKKLGWTFLALTVLGVASMAKPQGEAEAFYSPLDPCRYVSYCR